MKALTAAALIIVMSTASAYSQADDKGPLTNRTDEQKKEDAAVDKAYRAANERRAPAPKTDPWQTVRPATPAAPDKSKH